MYYPEYSEYVYDGPVMLFDKCVTNRWIERTRAPSVSKARSNLMYRYKRDNGLAPNAKIILPGKLTRVD